MNALPKTLTASPGGAHGTGTMAKGQIRSNKEARKPKAKAPKKANASKPSRKTLGISNA